MRISDWSSDVCSSDLLCLDAGHTPFFPYLLDRELIGGADEDEEHHDADRGDDHRLDQPRSVGYRGDVAKARRRDRDHREIDDIEKADLAVVAVPQPRAVDPVDEHDDRDQEEGDAEARDEVGPDRPFAHARSEENTSELQSLMRISYERFCLKKKLKIKDK